MLNTSLGTVPLSVFDQILKARERHSLAVDETTNRTRPTVAMLADIAKIVSNSLQVNATISQAWQLWQTCLAFEASAINNDSMRAEVSFWYGVDAYKMSDREVGKLSCNLYRVQAQKRIEEGNFDPLDYKTVYSLFLIAYDDENRALKARASSIEAMTERKG